MSCLKCGGEMIGDGHTAVLHCEYADEEEYLYLAPDSDPVYCDFEDNKE